ncbi:MAG: glycogen/starch synthase [Weeksellaceae bacterium]|jgi:starch synthase|nr:glycogen/starch synthase [Weeksellaceae bacterium]
MDGNRILYVTTEMIPYFPESPMSLQSLKIPKAMNEKGADVRIFMPRFGVINERRHQLHEVIRLSGMNLIINDMDQPLIIKVASVPGERIQVYFIDNEEYFKRKSVYTDNDGNFFSDNDERAIFFAKGVLETVKKLNWKPDVVHILGWMSGLVPAYIKEYYAKDSFFNEAKVVVSLYDSPFEGELNADIGSKLAFDGINGEVAKYLKNPDYEAMVKSALKYADAAVKGEEFLPESINEYLKSKNIPVMEYCPVDGICEAYKVFYAEELMNES